MMLTQDFLIDHRIKNVHVEISKDMKHVIVDVVFMDRPRFSFEIEVVSNLYDDIGYKINEYIVTHDRRKKLQKIKNRLFYGYFRRLFKRT